MDIIDEKIKEMFEQGKNDFEIASVIGRTIPTVQIRRRILGLRKIRSKHFDERLKNQIIELRNSGKTYDEIGRMLNINKKTVSRYCHGAGIGGEKMPRKRFLKVHFNNPYVKHSSFVISMGHFYIKQLDVPIDKELVAKVTPEKPNKLIIEIFEKDKVEVEK